MPLTLESVAHVLKRDTRAQHEALEALLHPLLAHMHTADEYARILETFYGYFHPLQESIIKFITRAVLEDIEERRYASLILNDLDSLGFPYKGRICTDIPVIDSVAAAFGALYVLEGSTLGGRIISKMLQKNQSVQLSSDTLSFFNGYGESTGQKWQFFVQVLNQQKDVHIVVEAANQTFLHFKHWASKTLYVTTN